MGVEVSGENSAQNTTEIKLNSSEKLHEIQNFGSVTETNVEPSENNNHSCGCMHEDSNMTMEKTYVYAIGRIRPVFRSLAIEKEYAQVLGKNKTSGLSDFETLTSVLSKSENRYLVRQICWVLNIEGIDAYVLRPLHPDDWDYFVNALNPPSDPTDVNVVIGVRGPNSDPNMCGGLTLPIAAISNIYSFDVESLIKTIPKPPNQAEKNFRQAAREVFYRMIQLADNFGTTDEHRALNYLAVRYSAIYANTAQMFLNDSSLSGVEVVHSSLSLSRKIVDVIFTYVDRKTDVSSKFFVRVDVTEEFPFLVTKLSPYYDR